MRVFSCSVSARRISGSADLVDDFCEFCRISYLRYIRSAGLLRSLFCDASPAVDAFVSRFRQMSIRSSRDDGYDLCDSEFCRFLDRPLHAIEFEDRYHHRKIERWPSGHRFAQLKLHAAVIDTDNLPHSDLTVGGDIELLPDLRAQYADQMLRVLTKQQGAVSMHFIGNPAAASHFSG